jgi:tetratricopeptide (TPR) repeat protein
MSRRNALDLSVSTLLGAGLIRLDRVDSPIFGSNLMGLSRMTISLEVPIRAKVDFREPRFRFQAILAAIALASTLAIFPLSTRSYAPLSPDESTSDDKAKPRSNDTKSGGNPHAISDQDRVEAIAHNRRGIELALKERNDDAIAEFRAAVVLDPDYVEARNNLGMVFKREGELDRAIAEFQTSVKLDPEDADSHENLASALFDKGRFGDSLAEYRKLARINPRHPQAHYNIGFLLVKSGELTESIGEFREAIRLKPDFVGAHFILGLAYKSRGEIDRAIEEFQAAIRIKSDHISARRNLVDALNRTRRYDEAIAAARDSIERFPRNAWPHWILATTYLRSAKFDAAVGELKLARERIAADPAAARAIQAEFDRCSRLSQIDKRFNEYLSRELKPATALERIGFAEICYYKGMFARSSDEYAAAFAQDPALSADATKVYRYAAACSAALAGTGAGNDDPKPSEAEKAELRGRALRSLKDEFRRAASSSKKNPGVIILLIDSWRSDPDLFGVRDPAALAKLPAAERDEWAKFWNEVDRVEKQARVDERNEQKR